MMKIDQQACFAEWWNEWWTEPANFIYTLLWCLGIAIFIYMYDHRRMYNSTYKENEKRKKNTTLFFILESNRIHGTHWTFFFFPVNFHKVNEDLLWIFIPYWGVTVTVWIVLKQQDSQSSKNLLHHLTHSSAKPWQLLCDQVLFPQPQGEHLCAFAPAFLLFPLLKADSRWDLLHKYLNYNVINQMVINFLRWTSAAEC